MNQHNLLKKKQQQQKQNKRKQQKNRYILMKYAIPSNLHTSMKNVSCANKTKIIVNGSYLSEDKNNQKSDSSSKVISP